MLASQVKIANGVLSETGLALSLASAQFFEALSTFEKALAVRNEVVRNKHRFSEDDDVDGVLLAQILEQFEPEHISVAGSTLLDAYTDFMAKLVPISKDLLHSDAIIKL